jgi:alkane 1-monooxygenase
MTEMSLERPAEAPYKDRKRLAWLMSLAVPMGVAAGPLLWLWSGHDLALWAPMIFVYGIAPFIDLWLGEDRSNPPESAVPALEAELFYRAVTYALVPLLWAAFIYGCWFTSHYYAELPWHGVLAVIISTGLVGGFCINLGHELGHKRSGFERWLAKIVLAPTAYGHFFIEHNRGHHRDVATPADPASSRMGESIWRFVWREMPGAARRAWRLEADRLRAQGRPVLSLDNEIIQPALITLALWAALMLWLGPQILLFILPASLWSNFQLTTANYIEHYGLLRQPRAPAADGSPRYEICQPHHSWNSNQVFSNWALFHLQRHSDHHAHPLRRYQSLRHFDNLPTLPNGYFGMFSIAYITPWWFKVMDQRLIDTVGRDLSKLNIDPRRREALIRRWDLR